MYRYEDLKPKLFTDEGQRDFLKVRDETERLLKIAGAFRADKVLKVVSGDSWFQLACIDRLVELGEIRELVNYPTPALQTRVYIGRDR